MPPHSAKHRAPESTVPPTQAQRPLGASGSARNACSTCGQPPTTACGEPRMASSGTSTRLPSSSSTRTYPGGTPHPTCPSPGTSMTVPSRRSTLKLIRDPTATRGGTKRMARQLPASGEKYAPCRGVPVRCPRGRSASKHRQCAHDADDGRALARDVRRPAALVRSKPGTRVVHDRSRLPDGLVAPVTLNIAGHSKMGKDELRRAVARAVIPSG
jgi:hypothetical protein